MNPITDERLMAYADDEVDAVERESIESELRRDPMLAARVREMKQQRVRLQAGLRAELDEPVPARLTGLLDVRPPSKVVDLAAQRARRAADAPRRVGSTWWQWGGMAASLLLGVAIASLWSSREAAPFAERGGMLVAQGEVERTLSSRLASDAGTAVAVPLSFVDQSGAYCRAFALERSAGLACRQGDAWVLQTLAAAEPAPGGTVRPAASALPAAVLQAVDARIAGDTLGAEAERAARDRGWRR